MSYYAYQTPYPRCPPIYDNGHSSDMDQHGIPLLYHHQPSSPDESPSLSSAPGTNFSHHDFPIGQASAIAGYANSPYQPAQALGQGFPSSAGQGIGTSRGPQPYGSDMRQTQYMPTQSHTNSHPSSSDCYMTPLNDEAFINFPSDDSHSPTSLPSTSVDSRRTQDPHRPSDQETEAYLRKSIPIAEGKQVNLWSLPESAKAPKISDMIKLAIWGSRNHQLTLRQIYDEIENRYPHLKDAQDKPWQRSIRHNLSLKAMFIREERPQSDPGKGYYWTLNVAMGEGNKRDRKRKRDGQPIKEEDDDTDFSSESQGYPDTTPSPSSSLRRPPPQHDPDHTHQAMYTNPQQSMMHGQMQYAAPPFHGMMLNQTAPGVPASYNAVMGHPQNLLFQTVHAGLALTNPAWVSQPQVGMLGLPGPGIIAQDHYHHHHHHHQDVSSSQRRNPTGGMSTRSQQQAGRLSHPMMPMQGDFTPSIGGVSHLSTRSSRRPHSDTSPEADEDEQARSGPRQRSGNRS